MESWIHGGTKPVSCYYLILAMDEETDPCVQVEKWQIGGGKMRGNGEYVCCRSSFKLHEVTNCVKMFSKVHGELDSGLLEACILLSQEKSFMEMGQIAYCVYGNWTK